MKILQSINDIEKIIRKYLISQSQVQSNFVRNSLSIYGEALEKVLSEQIYNSINANDVMILFELKERQNTSDVSETNDSNVIDYYKSYKIHVIIYGDNSTNIANNIVARFRTIYIRDILREEGVYLEQISDASKINEYINETMWLRNDVDIDISCHLQIAQIEQDYIADTLNDVLINI